MVLFFDIDGTLLHTTGCGMASILEAGRELHGPSFTLEGIPVAGRLDPLIFSDAFERNNIPDTHEHHVALRRAYIPKLNTRLQTTATATVLPGVNSLLDALTDAHTQSRVTLSLLTGNFQESGTLKLVRCGIDPARFAFGVWGDDGPPKPKREDLVPVGMRRADAFRSRPHAHNDFVVIGDTPHDVRCAKVHGGRCLAVATGQFSLEQLRDAGADLAVPTLEATDELVAWLTRN
jgi:phosphoglycolate phosphatase